MSFKRGHRRLKIITLQSEEWCRRYDEYHDKGSIA